MKILVVGSFMWEIYERPLCEAFKKLGHEVLTFEWFKYFKKDGYLYKLYQKIEGRINAGSDITRINKDLVKCCINVKPDLVFIYRGVLIKKRTIDLIKNEGCTVIGYNNDDPFDKRYPSLFWKCFLNSVPAYNFIYSYRKKNINDYKEHYGIDSELLRSYYIKERNYPINEIKKNGSKYSCDVIFIGHYEDDDRDEYLAALLNHNVSLKIYGDGWSKSAYYQLICEYMGEEIHQVRDEYNIAINSAKIAVVFLSKLNNDTYTRRCFEIPAAKTFMLCERTEDLMTLFKSDYEAVFFSNKNEFVEKTLYYLQNDAARIAIANAGYKRVVDDGHEIIDRAKQIVNKALLLKE